MARGRIDLPSLDDRTWQDLVNQAKALIPQYAPEWTDHNPSDLGITLIELFAWLVEQMIYRLNRVPEKNYIAFLNLLGITRDPATPATTFLTYGAANGAILVPRGTHAATRQTRGEEAVVFETDKDFNVLPINLVSALKVSRCEQPSDPPYTCEDLTSRLVALSDNDAEKREFLIPAKKAVMLALGFDKKIEGSPGTQLQLHFRFSKPLGKPSLIPGLTGTVLSDLYEYGKPRSTLLREIEALTARIHQAQDPQEIEVLNEQMDKLQRRKKVFSELQKALARGGFLLQDQHIVQKRVTEWSISGKGSGNMRALYLLRKIGDQWELRPMLLPSGVDWRALQNIPEDFETNLLTVAGDNQPGSQNACSQLQAALNANNIVLLKIEVVQPTQEYWCIRDEGAFSKPSIHIARGSSPLCGLMDPVEIEWSYSSGENLPFEWPKTEKGRISDGTDGFRRDGIVSLPVPKTWSQQKSAPWYTKEGDSEAKPAYDCYWIGARVANLGETDVAFYPACLLFNSVSATHALSVKNEHLGTSDGKPFQRFELAHRPLYKQPPPTTPYGHLKIEVAQKDGVEEWACREILPTGAGKFYRLDPVTGTIYFGNHDSHAGDLTTTAHGTIPPADSEIRAGYRYVAGGRSGNVPAHHISVQYDPIPSIISVTNPLPAIGGIDEESVDEAKQRAPELLENRFRAVTLQDYEYLAREASPRVATVCALPPLEPEDGNTPMSGGLNREVGHVNVIIIPTLTVKNPLDEPRPLPSDDLLREVYDYLDERRSLTTRLHVERPRYLPITFEATIKVWPEALPVEPDARTEFIETLKDEAETHVRTFLHPLTGGPEQQGWEFGQHLLQSDLLKAVQPDPKVAYIQEITARADEPEHTRPPDMTDLAYGVQVADFEIVCSSDRHSVTVKQ